MSSSIWMQCEGDSRRRPLQCTAWRVVESQHEVATRKLVSTAAEQELLEQLVEGVKPPAMVGANMHYLLFTPFRYPPLRHGSRFGTRQEPGIWYGSSNLATAFAEVAFYRLLFLEGTTASLTPISTTLSSFTVRMRSARGIDLTDAPFAEHRARIASRRSYRYSQPLGSAMRQANVELFVFPSARDVNGGTNVGAFTPAVFHKASPQQLQRWYCVATHDAVEFSASGPVRSRITHVYDRAQFLVDGVLPTPSLP
ncbi:RES family NAD+ phosphorylase [Gemmatimonas sp.]|jgi:hypothetical protein|uniref:RES family NAD+ phosphorylase n=1 Tax=Gemmatimonas sp. TaxID=1962908 RepID=UPI0031C43B7B|nr:RES family NAD+ phosphorylase [Gemmatimonas sp.]